MLRPSREAATWHQLSIVILVANWTRILKSKIRSGASRHAITANNALPSPLNTTGLLPIVQDEESSESLCPRQRCTSSRPLSPAAMAPKPANCSQSAHCQLTIRFQQRVRQSWNKYNLYNLQKWICPVRYGTATLFQQKWAAKAATRAYHGEHIGEKRWRRDFSRRLRGVVNMPPRYLARYDGHEQAEGRGSGRASHRWSISVDMFAPRLKTIRAAACGQLSATTEFGPQPIASRVASFLNSAKIRRSSPHLAFRDSYENMTPYMQMTYAPLERRLDVAMHRALFASSPRQARQFCIHGAVKVNGKKVSPLLPGPPIKDVPTKLTCRT
jgi:ribosomal protein S4